MGSETYEAIGRDCKALGDRLEHHLPMGAVSDWKGAIVSAVATHFGEIPHQRCLTLLETHRDPSVWKTMLTRWHHDYGSMLTEKTQAPTGTSRSWWYTHGNLRRAWRLLTYDQDPLFVFLINSLIPNTNNALEGVNSNLKQKLEDHRGHEDSPASGISFVVHGVYQVEK